MSADNETLESWKEIAAYLKRDVTTVQRWEKREGLPVHRLLHDKSGSVFARKSELDRWRLARTRAAEAADLLPAVLPEEPASPLRTPVTTPDSPTPSVSQGLGARRALWVTAGIAALIVTVGALRSGSIPEPPPPIAFTVTPTNGTALVPNEAPLIAPDGRTLIFVGIGSDGITRLYARALGQTTASVLPGTEGARYPFWSTDSRQVAFFAEGKLKALSVSGGEPRAICEAPFGQAGTWGEDGVILFPLTAQSGLYRVRMEGGTPVKVTQPDAASGDYAHRAPHFLPGGRRFVFLVRSTMPQREGIYVGHLDGGTPRHVLRALSEAWYSSGHLLFVQPPALMAVRVNATTLAQEGSPVALTREASHESFTGRGLFSVSSNGTVVFSAMRTPAMRLATYDRHGRRGDTDVVPGVFWDLARAPDGAALALTRLDLASNTRDIWRVDLASYQSDRLTINVADDAMPVWAPDGSRFAFSSRRLGTYDIFVQAAVDAAPATPIVIGDGDQWINDWSNDGQRILYSATSTGNSTRSDLFVFHLAEGRTETVVRTSGRDTQGRFSPDGRWIAYTCDERGQPDVYVMAYPPRAGKHTLVSPSGGGYPRWRADGGELYYVDSAGSLVAAELAMSETASVRGVQVLIRGVFASLGPAISGLGADYSPSHDGDSFLIKEPTEAVAGPITVMVNGVWHNRP